MNTENPKQFAHVGRPGLILALYDDLNPVKESDAGWVIGSDGYAVKEDNPRYGVDNSTPNSMFNRFSLIKMIFITKDGQPYINISPEMVDMIYMRTQGAVTAHTIGLMQQSASIPQSPAYTARFNAGRLAGKTCCEIIAEKGAEGVQELTNQYNWLQQNLQKYPKNQQLMNAISEAVGLYNSGQLVTNLNTASFSPVTILDVPIQSSLSKTNASGKSLVRTASVVADYNNQNPYTVKISNSYAQIQVLEDRKQKVMWNGAEDRTEKSINMTEAEWLYFSGMIKTVRDSYCNSVYAYEKNIAKKYDDANRRNAKNSAGQAANQNSYVQQNYQQNTPYGAA